MLILHTFETKRLLLKRMSFFKYKIDLFTIKSKMGIYFCVKDVDSVLRDCVIIVSILRLFLTFHLYYCRNVYFDAHFIG